MGYPINKKKKPKKRQPIKNYVMWLLGRQDYSVFSIRSKLKEKEYPEIEIEELIEEFVDRGYLDDKRYFEQLLRSTIAGRKGLYKAKGKAKEKGVPEDVISEVLEEDDTDWVQLARECRESKFGGDLPEDYDSKIKQVKFLVNRGFNYDEANQAFEGND